MTYAIIDDLVSRFGSNEIIGLTDKAGDMGGIVDAVANQALDEATSEIDSYISKIYATPIEAPVPDLIVAFCCDIARYRLYSDKPLPIVSARYTEAINWLKNISKGLAVLPIKAILPLDSTLYAVKARSQVFTDTMLSKYF